MSLRPKRRWAAVVLLLALFGFGAGIHVSTQASPSTHPHASLSAPGASSAAPVLDHPHLRDATPSAPDLLATAGLPRTNTTLLALVLVAALCVGAVCWSARVSDIGRGPPRGAVLFQTGRGVLTRLCIARR